MFSFFFFFHVNQSSSATFVVFVLFILSRHFRFRGPGQFCLDNKITRLGSFFVFYHYASYTFSLPPRRDVMC